MNATVKSIPDLILGGRNKRRHQEAAQKIRNNIVLSVILFFVVFAFGTLLQTAYNAYSESIKSSGLSYTNPDYFDLHFGFPYSASGLSDTNREVTPDFQSYSYTAEKFVRVDNAEENFFELVEDLVPEDRVFELGENFVQADNVFELRSSSADKQTHLVTFASSSSAENNTFVDFFGLIPEEETTMSKSPQEIAQDYISSDKK